MENFMKRLLLALVVFSLNASASSMYDTCTNAGGTILIDNFNTVTVVTHRDWNDHDKKEVEIFKRDQTVKIAKETEVVLDKSSSCSSSRVTYAVKVKISKMAEGESMPNAYSQNAQKDGTLVDTVLCQHVTTWMGTCNLE
jgi:Ni/Co efflux regulator RcnB